MDSIPWEKMLLCICLERYAGKPHDVRRVVNSGSGSVSRLTLNGSSSIGVGIACAVSNASLFDDVMGGGWR